MKGAKDSSIGVNISRDIIVNVEDIDDNTLEDDEQDVPALETAVNVCIVMSFGPLIRVFVRTIVSRSWLALKIPLSEAVKAPITAKEEVLDVHRDVDDGHLHFQDEDVASLFEEDGKKLLVEVIKEEHKVRATVLSATQLLHDYFPTTSQLLHDYFITT